MIYDLSLNVEIEQHESHANCMDSIILRGRTFTSNELSIICQCVAKDYEKGRTHISKAICRKLNWKQPNGWLKDRACRDVLLRLEEMGMIKLPQVIASRKSNKNSKERNRRSHLKNYDLVTPISEFPKSIELKFAKGNIYEKIWNELIDNYHYLGHSIAVGRCIKYLIIADDRLLGALAFSSPAWRLKPRDDALKRIGLTNPHDYTVNNTRFLILPIVRIPNIASHILSLSTKQIISDWINYYSITPLVAETFVQPTHFHGTCYKAANWVEVGTTKGYSKRGHFYHNNQQPKKIFLYGLNKKIRFQLSRLFSGVQ